MQECNGAPDLPMKSYMEQGCDLQKLDAVFQSLSLVL